MSAPVERIARRRIEQVADQIERAVEEAAPGIAIARDAEQVVLSGRAVRDHPRLRWIGGLIR